MTSPLPLPLLDDKRAPRHPYHATTSPKPSPPHFHCIESMQLLLCLPVLSSHWASVHNPVPDDLASKMIPIYSSRCSPMFSPQYPKITASGAMKQPRSDLPCSMLCPLFTSSNHDSISFLVLVDSNVPLMHQSLHIVSPDVPSVCARAFVELDHDATRNMIGAQSATPWPFLVQVWWSLDKVNSPINHHVNLMLQMHTNSFAQVLYSYL
jgi:hypothetical protein